MFGDVDLATVEELQEALECGRPRLEVDLSGVTFMDLSGLGCLIDAAETCDVVIVDSSPRVDRLLEVADAAHYFQIE